jgi:hypothetical protein
MREPRKDALYDVEILCPAGTLVNLKGADYDTAYSACIALQDSTKDSKLLEKLNSCMRDFGFCGSYGEGYGVSISAGLPRSKDGEKQTCGRRMREAGPWEREKGLDFWEQIGSDRVCSFCGSLHPDRVIEIIREQGLGVIEQSTKGYKMYVHQPNVPNASFGGIKYYRHHDTPQFVAELRALIESSKEDGGESTE